MSMVCGLDLHRAQITFDAVELRTGGVWRGRLWCPDRCRFRRWLTEEVALRAKGEPVAMAVEGCTGWRYVVEEISARGLRGAPGRAGGHPGRPRTQAARQDRSQRRPPAAGAAGCWRFARVVDSTRAGAGVEGAGAALQVAGRPAHPVDPADPDPD